MPKRPRPIVLTVLDGWGYRPETKGNAVALARKVSNSSCRVSTAADTELTV